MKIDLKELIPEFNKNLKLDYDLKKKNWFNIGGKTKAFYKACLLYTSPSPRDAHESRMPSSA